MFTPSTAGVRIVTTTDIACHLYCRLSPKKPWIHKKPSLRRGVQFAEDVRFCFTVYEDNEQYEAGDTCEHTWYKTDWPVCQTKYFYFWGTIGIEVSVSTTPFFKYHNDGVSPVVPWLMIFQEPWTEGVGPPIQTELVFYEPWTYETPPWQQVFYEPWTE